ncbi:RNA exonuclease 1 homolog [Palaemon carinicauda]|uniref:RNA exonuclease 1 homolog n=1 Tax=Palaemon carinicauda TaxID=392227 RepID=UPI0035B5BCA6
MMDPSQYEKLERHVLSENVMNQFSYPRPHPHVKGQALISNAREHYFQIPSNGTRGCIRCGAVYSVYESGKAVKPEVCVYHSKRKPNQGQQYRCCGGNYNAKPCRTAPQHVSEEFDLSNMTGFLLTKDNTSVTGQEAYALDTEMIYTECGREVACLTIVNTKCEVVYETMILPENPIVDYNTEFSKLTSSDFAGVTTTLKDVHKKLLTLWGPNTILIGHGLESDLIKLKVIHDKVVDTLVLYPHKRGFPFMNSLQYLKDTYLPQCTYEGSSKKCSEDAIAAMKLVKRKINGPSRKIVQYNLIG